MDREYSMKLHRYINTAVFAVVAFTSTFVSARQPAPPELLREINQAVDLIADHSYTQAEQALDELLAENPGSAVLHFQKMALYYTWLDDYGIVDSLRTPFQAEVESTLVCSRRDIEADDTDGWAYYFRGSAYSYRSLYKSYTEGIGIMNVRGLARDAGRGIDDMKRAYDRDTTITDVLLGVGKYYHWRSKKLPWFLRDSDDREKGIRMMEEALERGLHWQMAGVQTLCSVYMAEERYEDIITIATPMLERYPRSRFFSIPIARAHMYLGRYDIADSLLHSIRENFTDEENAAPLAVLKLERYIAELREKQGRPEEACAIARRLKNADYTGVHSDWLRRKIGVVNRVMRRTCGH